MLGKDAVESLLKTKWAARELIYKEVTGSTNNDAAELGKEGAPHGSLVVADRQSAGRGSKGRSWETPGGCNIAMSLLLRPNAPTDRVSMLTLIMGLSVAEGIEEALRVSDGGVSDSSFPMIKWPNDVVINGKKICGILTELHMNHDNTINNVVIGVGINVNMLDFPEDIRDIAGSVLLETGVRLDRALIVSMCMERFEDNYEKYRKSFDMSLLKEQYERRLINRDRAVKIIDKDREFEGVALGITDGGALNVRLASGEVLSVNAGEVSVRGLYGYT